MLCTKLPARTPFKHYQLASQLHFRTNTLSILVMKDHFKERKDGQNRSTRYLHRSRRGDTDREEGDEKEKPPAWKTNCPCLIIFPGGCLVIRSQSCAQFICAQTTSSQGWETGFSHRVQDMSC